MDTSYYDPKTDQLHLKPGASLYERFHETAHRDQWQNSRLWRFVIRLRRIPFVKYLATLAVEYDALRRARQVMRNLGIWSHHASNEAGAMFNSYVKKEPL